jgi:hypothetical protein
MSCTCKHMNLNVCKSHAWWLAYSFKHGLCLCPVIFANCLIPVDAAWQMAPYIEAVNAQEQSDPMVRKFFWPVMLIPSNISWGVFIFVFSFHMYLGLLVLWPFKVHEMVGFLRSELFVNCCGLDGNACVQEQRSVHMRWWRIWYLVSPLFFSVVRVDHYCRSSTLFYQNI